MTTHCEIAIIGRKGSKAVSSIIESTLLCRYHKRAVLVVNYGLAGARMHSFIARNPSLLKKKMINKNVSGSKFKTLKSIEKKGIVMVPETYKKLPGSKDVNDFLVKRYFSYGGIGIEKASSKFPPAGKYFQRFITNRKYELRVHGFLWIPEHDWLVQKRIGEKDKIAWNFKQGGKFQTINHKLGIFEKAIDVSKEILLTKNMAFGAIDFIVTDNLDLLFIEINSAPGFTELSKGFYISSFNELCKMPQKERIKFSQ